MLAIISQVSPSTVNNRIDVYNLDTFKLINTYSDDCEVLDLCGIYPNSNYTGFATVNEKGVLKV